ncbi:MAG: 50S ribosomal protein L22 [Acidimicrobiales bacterium]
MKTNERPGTRASLRHCGMSAYKAREVLNIIRGQEYTRAVEILRFSDREAALVIGKLLHSAGANAFENDGIDAEETFVSACFADEGTTMKRWRPRARGRASRIRKRTCHITLILTRMPEDEIARRRAKTAAEQSERRARRVAGGRRRRAALEETAKKDQAVVLSENEEALEALEEARSLESESHHAGLESEAESALDQDHGDTAPAGVGDEAQADESEDAQAPTDEVGAPAEDTEEGADTEEDADTEEGADAEESPDAEESADTEEGEEN